ncbi:MAG: hypothetical protein M1829_003191 [Trizodia sp. TS-e1964]|nr:MAG: hypothetical protein M1829_003191 [Trizodia sp. TS-e1964]
MAAVTALNYIVDNIPDWMLRLDDLTTQISTRQVELAELTNNGKFKSLKHTGSTESLLPKDSYMIPGPSDAENAMPISHPLGSPSRLAGLQRQHMLQQARRKRKTVSIASGSGPSKYRTRSMIIVYYDSFVQDAFETLVRYISTARNNIRKAKMEMKMAAITALASQSSTSGPADGDEEDEVAVRARLQMTLSRSRMARGSAMPPRRTGPVLTSADMAPVTTPVMEPKTGFDTAEEALEQAQGLCEHAAHQFLRDGDCEVEISGIKKRLVETLAAVESERAKLDTEQRKKREKEEEEGEEEGQGEQEKPVEAEERKRAKKGSEDMRMDVDGEVSSEPEPPLPTMMEVDTCAIPAPEPATKVPKVETVALEPGGAVQKVETVGLMPPEQKHADASSLIEIDSNF